MVPERTGASFHYTEGRVRFEIPRYRSTPGKLFGRMMGKSEHVHLKLDEVGSFIWEQIDGRKSVGQIARRLSERFGERIEPAEGRLAQFLQILESNRFIRYREGFT